MTDTKKLAKIAELQARAIIECTLAQLTTVYLDRKECMHRANAYTDELQRIAGGE